MKLEDVKEDLKVFVPTRKSVGFSYSEFYLALTKEFTYEEWPSYATVFKVHNTKEIELLFKSGSKFIHFNFCAEDITPYFQHTPHVEIGHSFVAGSEVVTGDANLQEPAIEIEEVTLTSPENQGSQVESVVVEELPYQVITTYLPGTDMSENKVEAITPKQGLRYNDGKLDYTLMDLSAFKSMIEVLEYGAHKYSVFENDASGAHIKGVDISKETVKLYNMKVISSGRDNWKLGGPNMSVLALLSSLMRHLVAFMSGQDTDEESKLPHIGHMMCNLMFIGYHWNNHKKLKKSKQATKFDNRFKS